jgi:predicted nucleotidyltransferase component of viral defense system
MITHEEIKNLVTQWGLREDIIEKDYVIGWVLWGISQEAHIKHKWIFKGGTCLKKCYFETYRFSEDLDFTVLPDGPIKPEDIAPFLGRILERISDESGINFSLVKPKLKQKKFPLYTEGRIYYQGPRNTPTPGSIKLDLSASEKMACPPVLRPIAHSSYSDEFPQDSKIMCYSLEELFAEKIRAMGERCRPRDLYDIIFLFRKGDFRNQHQLIKSVLETKCRTKGVSVPTFELISSSPYIDELRGEWENMLSHQLPALPPFEEYWRELPKLFEWLEGKYVERVLASLPLERGELPTWQPPPVVWNWGIGVSLESIRFAAVNHLCIELGYNGTRRIIEPYSLRKTREGNLILHAIRVDNREHRAYRVDRIQSVKVTTRPFIPVYQIEFSSTGTISAPPVPSKTRFTSMLGKKSKSIYGPTYIFECSICGRRFRRSNYNSTLRPHKDKSGLDCPGRTGIYVETKYY